MWRGKGNLTINITTLHKTATLVKLGHILRRKSPRVFPSDVVIRGLVRQQMEWTPEPEPSE